MTDLFNTSAPWPRDPSAILARAVDEVEARFGVPPVVVALFSGGTDSMLAADVAREHPAYLCAAQWDTRTGLPVVAEWSDEWSEREGLALRRVETPESFEAMVTGRAPGVPGGFPGPAMHGLYQNRLKDRARADFQRELVGSGELGRGVPILYVSGIRAAESATRARLLTTGPLEMRSRRRRLADGRMVVDARPRREVHVSPLLYLTNEGKRRVFAARGWKPNPASEALGISAECMCLCHGNAAEERKARAFDPAWGETRAKLEAAVRDAGYPWGPGENPPPAWSKTLDGEVYAGDAARAVANAPTLFDSPVPMCAGSCTRLTRLARQAA